MASPVQSVRTMLRGRDFALLALALATLYQFSFRALPWSVHLEPNWFIELAKSGDCQVSPAVVRDITGDGEAEVAFIDKDCCLKMFRLDSVEDRDTKLIYHPEEVPLPKMGALLAFDTVAFANEESSILVITKDLRIVSIGLTSKQQHWSTKLPDLLSTVGPVSVAASVEFGSVYVCISLCATQSCASEEEVLVAAFALDDGRLLWTQTLPTSAEQQWFRKSARVPYTPDITKHPAATSVVPKTWHTFKASFLRQLPFSWQRGQDSHVSLGKFRRQKVQAKSSAKKKAERGKMFTIEAGEVSSKSNHSGATNAVVVRSAHGLTALGVADGLVLSALTLKASTHGPVHFDDVNADGVVESIQFPAPDVGARRCKMSVLHGLPAHTQLFEAAICATTPSSQRANHTADANPQHVFALPLTMRSQLVVATAEGVLSAWSMKGAQLWKTSTAPRWAPSAPDARPSVSGFHVLPRDELERAKDFTHFLVVGASRVAVFSKDGSQHTVVEVPHVPVHMPVFGDFNGDGLNDVVLVTGREIIGLRLWYSSSESTVVSLLVVCASVALLVLVLHVRFSGDAGDQPTSPSKAARQRWVLSIVRSTDEHVD